MKVCANCGLKEDELKEKDGKYYCSDCFKYRYYDEYPSGKNGVGVTILTFGIIIFMIGFYAGLYFLTGNLIIGIGLIMGSIFLGSVLLGLAEVIFLLDKLKDKQVH